MNLSIRWKINEACENYGLSRDQVYEYIEYKWVTPVDAENEYLDEEDIARIKLIQDLIDDMGVNDEGISIILDLVDQLNCLHREMKTKRGQI